MTKARSGHCVTTDETTTVFDQLRERPVSHGVVAEPESGGVAVGELIAIADDGRTALVLYPGQTGTAAVRAASVIDLQGAHVGHQVVLAFDAGDRLKPIVMGVLRDAAGSTLDPPAGQVTVDADGERLVVSAKNQLVLSCGAASITLTRSGKVLIQGTYVLSRSAGVNRVKGGSVQIN